MPKKVLSVFAYIFIFFGQIVVAQVTTGIISGTVRDESGGVLPGAKVSIRNVETGASREVVADSAGRYRAPQLSSGRYEAQAELSGFKTERRAGITLTVGAEVVLDFVMQVGAVTETVTVTGEAPLVESAGATVSGLVSGQEMADLPLNGRSFDQLITTESGSAFFKLDAGGQAQGFGTKFTVAGQRWEYNKFYQDGTEMLGASRSADVPGSASGLLLGVDAIREFRVLTNNYSAEYGKKPGGVVLTVTKSGTNELHGSVLVFHRNDNLDARNFFDREKPEFKRNNFGGSLGGPIKQDKMFIFGNYEGMRERLGVTRIAIVPDENARRGLLPGRTVAVNPVVVPYLSLFPLPDGRNFGDGTAESFNPASSSINEDYGTGRWDYNIGSSDFLFLSYTQNAASLTNPLENRFFTEAFSTRNHTATLQETHIFSPTLLHVARLGFNRAFFDALTIELIDIDPALSFIPGMKFGYIETGGQLSGVGGNTGPNTATMNLFQFNEQFIYTAGSHNLTLGWQIQKSQRNGLGADAGRGRYVFFALEELLSGRPNTFRGEGPPDLLGPLNIGIDIKPGDPNPIRGWRQTYGGFYAQDQWKVTDRVSLDLGLRFEFITVPQEVNGRTSHWNVKEVTVNPQAIVHETRPVIGEPILKSGSKSLAPRFGLAWDPFGNGKTSIRMGAGMFYAQVDNIFRFNQEVNPPFSTRADFRAPRFPRPFEGVDSTAITVSGRTIDPNMEPATVFHYNFGIQRELNADLVLKLGYVGSKGYHLSNSIESNLRPRDILPDGTKFIPAGRAFANPILGPNRILTSGANAWYNAFKVEVEKRFGGGLLSNARFKWGYTFGKSTDQGSSDQNTQTANSRQMPQDPFDLKREQALSTFNIRHNVTLNFTYELPRAFSDGLGAHVFNDWSVNGFMLLNSGFPSGIHSGFNASRDGAQSFADRPDLIPGGDNNPTNGVAGACAGVNAGKKVGGPEVYFDPCQFTLQPAGFMGNLGRNTMSGPGLASADFSLSKGIAVSEKTRLQFRAEFFNLLNRANFGVPPGGLFASTGARVASAGRITRTLTTARQIQFGLRYEF